MKLFSLMNALTIIPSNPEGFGSLLQYALNGYFLARFSNLPYYHTPFKFEHREQEGATEEEWNGRLNDAITNLFIPKCIRVDTKPSDMIIHTTQPTKAQIEAIVRNYSHELTHLAEFYQTSTRGRSCYFNLSKINVTIHARTFNTTDCDPSEFRECFSPGSITDIWIAQMIEQLRGIFPDIHFHLYAKTRSKAEHYATLPNLTIHSEGSVLDDLHHFIVSDILIMSKSSLSVIASYYRTKPCLMRDHYGFAVPPWVMFVRDNKLNPEQIKNLLSVK